MNLCDEPAIQQQAEDDMAERSGFWFLLVLGAIGLAIALGQACAEAAS